MVDYTTEPKLYQLTRPNNVILVDFPESISIMNHTDIFLEFGHIPNLYVLVSSYNGALDTTLIKNKLHACTMEVLGGKYCEVVFCLNKGYAAIKYRLYGGKGLANFKTQKIKY